MFIAKIAAAGLLGLVAVQALAQAPAMSDAAQMRAGLNNGDRESLPRSTKASNIVTSDTRSNVAPTLPSPGLNEAATSRDYLRAARASLAAGHTGQAQQSLEMAETRELGGSTAPDLAGRATDNPKVVEIKDALHALGSGDKAHAMQIIDVALRN
jgi:hypothetical protein